MDILNTLSNMNLRRLDPSRGVFVCTTYWRPQPEAPDPEQPGEKASVLSYLPTKAKEQCPCGSGTVFEACCQPRSEEHTSELQSRLHLVCRLLLEKKKYQHQQKQPD